VLVAGKEKKDEMSLDPPPASTPSKPLNTSPVPTVSSSSITSSTGHKSSTKAATKVGKKKGRKRVKLPKAPAASTSRTITSPTTEIPPDTKQIQVEVEPEAEEHGRRKRKVSRRARGIGYDESTPSPAKKRKIA
jgi:hypothetical protein